MHFSSKLRIAATSALLASTVIGIGLFMAHSGTAPATTALRGQSAPATTPDAFDPGRSAPLPATDAAALPQSAPRTQAATSISTTQASHAGPALLLPPSAAIRRVLPSVQEAVADWRLFAPERLTVEAVPGSPVEFECVELKRGGPNGEYNVWIGRAPGIPGATFVGVGAQNRWIGTQVVPGAHEHLLIIVGDDVRVIEKPDARCSTPLAASAALASEFPIALAAPSAPVALAADSSALSVDVVFFYGDDVFNTLAGYIGTNGPVAEFASFFATASIEQINQMLAQSGVTNFRWRLAGTEKVPTYTQKDTLDNELRAFTDNSSEPGKTVATRMTEIGADQAVFWIWAERSDSDTVAGIANTPGRASVIYMYMPDILTAHELGHNFGCRHDRQTSADRNEGARDGDSRYCYGYRFTKDGVDSGTIMSYASNRIPYFSNPDIPVSADVYYSGWTGTLATGVAASEPRGADNARWLREQATTLATTRELVTIPTIVTPPANTTVTAGHTLTLSVTASGGNLSYQWQKAGADLAGATTATYTKYNAASADAGSYTVTAHNNLGNVASTPATVTVNPAPAPAPSSGGGGGGALPIWFTAALVLVGASRRFGRSV